MDGAECDVRKTAGNRTYTVKEWCDGGCCQNADLSVSCCDIAALSQAMIYGIVVTACMVLLSLCIFIRMKRLASTKPRRPSSTRNHSRPGSSPETVPEINVVFEEEPPPPYWMCVAEDRPADVTTTPSVVTYSESDDEIADIVRARLYTITEEDLRTSDDSLAVRLRSSSVRSTSTNPAGLSEAVLLQPSALSTVAFPPAASTFPSSLVKAENELDPASVSTGVSFSQGAVFMFLPGQMSEDVRQSILRSSEASRCAVCHDLEANSKTAAASSSSVTESPPVESATELPRSDTDLPDTTASAASPSATLVSNPPPAATFLDTTSSQTTSTVTSSVSGPSSAKPSWERTSSATSSKETTSPGKTSLVSGSAVSDILRQLSSGMVVVFQKKDDPTSTVSDK